ncbi:MAG: tetratricopeptide repeat protein [Deltaproteobacteria bacterium]|nr:tetratricopeptide repeat protein [Deltaproteobacteria bacterium]
MIFALGLMAKPMLVTLPFVLLLLDYWPMDRIKISALKNTDKKKDASSSVVFERFSPLQLIAEKVPFLILSIFSVSLSSLSVKGLGTVISTEKIPVGLRIENALVSYVKYIGNLFWPENLAIFYPFPKTVPMWQTSGAIVLLGCVSIFVVQTIKEKPYLAIGWFWFLGTFVPVIGLVQVGLWPAMAGRFTYIPLIGLFVLIAWGVYDLTPKWHYRSIGLGILSPDILSIFLGLTWGQLHHWKNSISLFKQTLAVTDENYVIHYNMGVAMGKADNTAAAVDHYLAALKINPWFLGSYNNSGNILAKKGKTSEAIRYFDMALKIKPESDDIHNNLGLTLAESGRATEALQHFSEALRINPNFGEALYNMGNALAQQGHPSEAIRYFSKALEINPDDARVHNNLGLVLADQGETALAIEHYSQALTIKPDFAEAHYNMANALADQGLAGEAVEHYEKALDIHPRFLPALNNLSMIYAISGKNDKALTLMKRIVDYQPEQAETYYNIACIYARQNKRDQAIDWFQKAIERGYNNWDLIKTDRDLESIRDSSVYKDIIEDH